LVGETATAAQMGAISLVMLQLHLFTKIGHSGKLADGMDFSISRSMGRDFHRGFRFG